MINKIIKDQFSPHTSFILPFIPLIFTCPTLRSHNFISAYLPCGLASGASLILLLTRSFPLPLFHCTGHWIVAGRPVFTIRQFLSTPLLSQFLLLPPWWGISHQFAFKPLRTRVHTWYSSAGGCQVPVSWRFAQKWLAQSLACVRGELQRGLVGLTCVCVCVCLFLAEDTSLTCQEWVKPLELMHLNILHCIHIWVCVCVCVCVMCTTLPAPRVLALLPAAQQWLWEVMCQFVLIFKAKPRPAWKSRETVSSVQCTDHCFTKWTSHVFSVRLVLLHTL